jgi:GNAT superfamily N-acetyltransferase
MSDAPISIARIHPALLNGDQLAQIEAIFFETSTRAFEPGPERDAFRERWLGRYLRGGTDVLLLACEGGDRVVGYLVGALEDPAASPRFADISYFRDHFADLTRQFPAHLHVNLASPCRGRGIGARLIEAFARHAADAGAAGMHVVTGKGMRNVGFYRRCGFAERASASWNGRQIVFLAHRLGALADPAPHRDTAS